MDFYTQAAAKIISKQENVIGPLAWEQAKKVAGLHVDPTSGEIEFEGNKIDILENLVERYKGIFGQASVEVCREAVSDLVSQIPAGEIPPLLR